MHCSKEHCLFTYLIFKLLLYCVARSSLPYSSSQIPLLVSRGRERVEKQCIKGKQILLCERLLNELNTVWNIIIFIKQDLPDACFRWHQNITRVCLVVQQSTQSVSLFSEREKKCGTQQRQQQTNNQTITHLAAWRISFAIRLKGKLSVYCRYTRKRTKDQCCVRNLSVEDNCTNCLQVINCYLPDNAPYDIWYALRTLPLLLNVHAIARGWDLAPDTLRS